MQQGLKLCFDFTAVTERNVLSNLDMMSTLYLVFLYITNPSQFLCIHWEAGENAESPKGNINNRLLNIHIGNII